MSVDGAWCGGGEKKKKNKKNKAKPSQVSALLAQRRRTRNEISQETSFQED
jgi:hypothetical protein